MERRDFIKQAALAGISLGITSNTYGKSLDHESSFAKKLHPVGRALELEGQYVWCSSPIYDENGRVHLFFSHWDAKRGMGGWINACSISRAVAESAEKPFEVVGPVLQPRPDYFDSTTCHNPSIKKIDGKYCLFYMGNSNGKTNTKRIGLATATSLEGPWTRTDKPILEPGPEGAWDDHCTTNPSLIKNPRNGQYWLYYKSWNTKAYETETGPIRGNRKYGLAIADKLEGPYIKHNTNPLVDFSGRGNNTQLEDAYVWFEKDRFFMIARDMGYFNHENGIIMQSKDGIKWSAPEIAYYKVDAYVQQPPPPSHLKKYGRFERPQLLLKNGKPAYLFTTSQGGKFMTSSTFIFRIS